MKAGTVVVTLTAMFLDGWAWAGNEDTNQVPSALRLELDLVDGSIDGLGMDWRDGRDSIAFTQCGGVFVGATKMAFDRWYHVVYVYGGQGSHKFYVDGRESSGVNELGSLDTLSSGKLIVGAHPQRQQFFDGWMDELMIDDRAVTAAEVEQIYSLGK